MSVWTARTPGVADVVTLGNAVGGIAAMLSAAGLGPTDSFSAAGRFRTAALLLVVCTLLDVVDGAVARRWGGTPLGAPLDCLADAISFGVAPVMVLVAAVAPTATSVERMIVVAGALAFSLAALIRLADFAAHRSEERDFVGLPTTSACIAAIALGFLALPPVGLAAGLVALGVLMVSPLVYPAGTRMMGVLVCGWIFGGLGVVGLLDVRVCAVLALLVICVLVPGGSWWRARAEPSRST